MKAKTNKLAPTKFLKEVQKLKKQKGFTYTDESGKVWTGEMALAKHFGMTRAEFRARLKSETSTTLPVKTKWIPAESYAEDGRYYMEFPDGLRLIFDANGYVGYYNPNLSEAI